MKYFLNINKFCYICDIKQVNNMYHINDGPYYKGGKSFSLKESRLYLMYVNRYFKEKHYIEHVTNIGIFKHE